MGIGSYAEEVVCGAGVEEVMARPDGPVTEVDCQASTRSRRAAVCNDMDTSAKGMHRCQRRLPGQFGSDDACELSFGVFTFVLNI